MFWDKGYTPSQNIESLLQKENVTVEEFLDDEDILQECKTQKRNLIQYLTRPDIIKRLIELTITEPPEDVSINQRFKHANMACEILTFGLPSLDEKLVEDDTILQALYSYLENEPPLNPLLSSFFTKIFSMLISKRPEQDWFLYQKMCLQVLEFLKSRVNFLDLIYKHFETPVLVDLLLHIIREVQGGALKKNLYEWLTEQKLVERLIRILGQPDESEKHKNVAEFLCDLIKHGRQMRQTNQQENDSFEPAFVGSNPLLQSIENNAAISQLLDVMLNPDAKDSTIISGVTIVLTLVDETIVDEPASDIALQIIMNKEKENHDKIVSTIIEVIEPKLDHLHQLLKNPLQHNEIITTAAKMSPPFGLTRLQICRLFTVLLHTGNSNIINAICKTEYLNTLLKLFKEYCWNNFLHSEVEKCLHFIFSNNDNNINNNNCTNEIINKNNNHINDEIKNQDNENEQQEHVNSENVCENSESAGNDKNFDENNKNLDKNKELSSSNNNPSALQTYATVNCQVVPKLVECWILNKEIQSSDKGRRLGYMGHLIKIFNNIINSISNCEKLGALIESNLLDENILSNWQSITNKETGELHDCLITQQRMLANCNAYETADFGVSLPKEFHNENLASDFFNDLSCNLSDNLDDDPLNSSVNESALDKLCEFLDGDTLIDINCLLAPAEGDIALNLQKQLKVWDSMENDMDNDLYRLPTVSDLSNTGATSNAFSINTNPWGSDPFCSPNNFDASDDNASTGWDNFADFDSHFSSFVNDLGPVSNSSESKENMQKITNEINISSIGEKSDKNANNIEKVFDEDEDIEKNSTTDEIIKKMVEGVVQDEVTVSSNGPTLPEDEKMEITEEQNSPKDEYSSINKSKIINDGGGDAVTTTTS